MRIKKDRVKKQFLEYLQDEGISDNTLKFYRSDLSHFTGWVLLRSRSWGSLAETLTEALPYLSSQIAEDYKSFLIQNNIPINTSNRRLSTLRRFSRFLVETQLSKNDFASQIVNLQEVQSRKKKDSDFNNLIQLFEAQLSKEKIAENTIRSYLSDVKQFLNWMEKNHAHAA